MAELLPGYLIVGPDELKRDEAIKRMKKRLEASGMADFNIDEREAPKEEEAEEILGSLNTLPLGADFRLVVLTSCDNLSKAVSEALVGYFANPSPSTVCLVQAKALAKNTRLYKAMAKLGPKAVIDCSAKKPKDLVAYVQRLAERAGLRMDPAAAAELIARSGENTRTLNNDVQRLSTLCANGVVRTEDVKLNIQRTTEAKPWELTDAVSNRDVKRALELFAAQPEKNHVYIFSLICTRLRELLRAKANETRKQDLATFIGLRKNMAWKAKDYARWARKFTTEELERALRDAVAVELALKGSADARSAMVLWIAQICTSCDAH